jgi:hypothetical protein
LFGKIQEPKKQINKNLVWEVLKRHEPSEDTFLYGEKAMGEAENDEMGKK